MENVIIASLKNEKWHILLDNAYLISNLGRIYSIPYKRIMKTRIDKYGYENVSLKKIKSCPMTVHRIIAKHFIPNPENKPQVNHINGIKTDNRIENLEWCTVQENITHSVQNGLKGTTKGQKRKYRVEQPLRRKEVEEIDFNGKIINYFESQSDASKKTGINNVYISRCCLSKQKNTFGRYFRFKI